MNFRLGCIITFSFFFSITIYSSHFHVKLLQSFCEEYEEFWNSVSVEQMNHSLMKRTSPINPKVSVIIPCYYKHAKYLYGLLSMYEKQTRLPDEVIISVSEPQFLSSVTLQNLKDELWAFPVTLILCRSRQGPGKNRNTACSYATGDVFICQDADDIPHPQRTEVIHYFFSIYALDHLMHEYTRISESDDAVLFNDYSLLGHIQFLSLPTFEEVFQVRKFTNGNVAIARSVFEQLQWPDQSRGEDVLFNRAVYEKCNQCVVIRAQLHGYREFLSSTVKIDAYPKKIIVETVPEKDIDKKYSVQIIKRRKERVS